MACRWSCLAALVLQTLLPLSSGAFFENNADALRELDIPVAKSLHELKPFGKRQSNNLIAARSGSKGTSPTRTLFDGTNYAIDITLGGKTYAFLFDTGSSAFWMPRANFTCVDFNNTAKPASTCGFASDGPEEYTGGRLADQNFQVAYISGEFATGTVGREDVTFAGLTVKNQHLGLAERAFFVNQNGLTSGIMGWGLGNYTTFYPGDDPKLNNKTDPNHTWIPTNTWILNAVEQGLLEKPIFSVNLGNRTENARNLSASGFVAVGGVPLEGLPYSGVWAHSSITPETYAPWGLENKYTHWNVRPDGFLIDQTFVPWKPGNFADGGNEIFTVLDTGTTWSYITNETVQVIAKSMQPPATWSVPDGAYVAMCNATVPKVSIRINGTDLPIAKREVLLDGYLGQANDSPTLCWLGLQPAFEPPRGGAAPYILGSTFLRNVLAVHDVGNLRMAFASLKWN